VRRPLIFRVWIPETNNEPHSLVFCQRRKNVTLKSCRDGAQRAATLQNRPELAKSRGRNETLLLLVALVGGLFSALGWFCAFFALFFLLALLDDFGLGWRCARGCHFGRLLFFDL
jgi:hypothetical protein